MTAASSVGAKRLRQMASELIDIATAIEKDEPSVFRFSRTRPSDSNAMLMPHLAQQADEEYRLRRDRLPTLANVLLGEPAWDILLDLFIQQTKGRHVSTTSACIASAAPMTTALRYLKLLESNGLIQSSRLNQDDRVRVVELSPQGLRVMTDYLARRSKVSGVSDPVASPCGNLT